MKCKTNILCTEEANGHPPLSAVDAKYPCLGGSRTVNRSFPGAESTSDADRKSVVMRASAPSFTSSCRLVVTVGNVSSSKFVKNKYIITDLYEKSILVLTFSYPGLTIYNISLLILIFVNFEDFTNTSALNLSLK